ncbi:response regulator [Elioraea sp. Yellowstone]|jgi:two-component system cell cycle sensor histidine kinase/response regulator CckA|uniref:ATP-binding protein n=1 Tax=Elioraea sp. Yellowstone TaxID=2592070 RepID=UPI0011525B03|nr:ATP-binding protein [Elioraea sp. Yellowstone]TQF81298.1 response regulator [Elioraea sp. Yellowstone]
MRTEQARSDGPALIDRLVHSDGEAWRTLFDEAPTGIVIVDVAGGLLLANEAAQALAGRTDQPVPRGVPVTELFHAEDRAKVEAELSRIAAGLGGRASVELRLAERQGEGGIALGCSVAMVAFTPIVEPGGRVSGAVIRLTDITRHRVMETQLAQTQKMQAVGQLAGGIAHDFNNLLTAIIAATDLCLAHDGLVEPLQADLLHIRRSAERGAALVKQLLAFSRRQTLQPRVIRLADAIEDIAALLRRLLGQRVALELDLELPSHMIRVDPVQFDQVIVNLALNARDAMPQGGRLTIRTSNIVLYRPLVRGQEVIPPGRYAMVEVSDTGVGIAPDDLPRLFEPFFSTRKEAGGTGLGLATVYGIVRQTDGFISVESTLGEGATFRIYLPIVAQEEVETRERAAERPPPAPAEPPDRAPPQPEAAAGPPPGRQRGTVLLVEDEDGVRRLSTRALESAGWRVLAAASGEAAMQMLEAEPGPPSVLVSDVVMPGMDGTQVVRAVRARHPGLPVVLVSGYSESAALEGLPEEDLHFLPKPYTLRQLVARVEQLAAEAAR